ncbi:MAG: hypothetical protein KatS3mg110_3823 [Pirellulaceae bacterium]|nr:MAG: hypothetical protein KatS3mg110_3823 [Pirellulaceae bacterium]
MNLRMFWRAVAAWLSGVLPVAVAVETSRAEALYRELPVPFVDQNSGRPVPLELPSGFQEGDRLFRHRQSSWEPSPPRNWPAWNWTWLRAVRQFLRSWWDLLQTIGIALLLALLAVVLWRAWRLGRWSGMRAKGVKPGAPDVSVLRELLPERRTAQEVDLWETAWQRFRSGDLRAAVIFLYCCLLVALNDRKIIRVRRGKTCRDYLKELQAWPKLREPFQQVVQLYESVFFGQITVPQARAEEAFAAAESLRSRLAALSVDVPETVPPVPADRIHLGNEAP